MPKKQTPASGSLHPPCSPCSPWSGVDWRKTDAVIAQEIGASGSLHPPCSPCPVCADVRVRLKGHECSQLDGEHGLAAATMRGFERLLELETWPAKFRAEAAELRKANTPKATGGAIVYEDIAAAIGQLLKPNA